MTPKQPATAAGRELYALLHNDDRWVIDDAAPILAIEAEAVLCEGSCGDLSWTIERYGYPTHKHACRRRTRCQSHPDGCPAEAAAPTSGSLREALERLVATVRDQIHPMDEPYDAFWEPMAQADAALAATPEPEGLDKDALRRAVEFAFENAKEWQRDPVHSFMANPVWPFDKFTDAVAAEYTRLMRERQP